MFWLCQKKKGHAWVHARAFSSTLDMTIYETIWDYSMSKVMLMPLITLLRSGSWSRTLKILSFVIVGQSETRRLNRSSWVLLSVSILSRAGSRVAVEPMKSKHASLRAAHWCFSARSNMSSTESRSIRLHSLYSHIDFSLCRPYRSAATSNCWAIAESFWSFGHVSVYMKVSIALNTCGSISSTCMTLVVLRSPAESSALKIADRAPSNSRCAANVSSPTWNSTSVCSLLDRRSPRWRCMSDGGSAIDDDGSPSSLIISRSTLRAKQSCLRHLLANAVFATSVWYPCHPSCSEKVNVVGGRLYSFNFMSWSRKLNVALTFTDWSATGSTR